MQFLPLDHPLRQTFFPSYLEGVGSNLKRALTISHLKNYENGGCIAQWIAFSLHTQWPQVRFLNFSEFLMLPRSIDSGAAQSSRDHRLDNVYRTHLVLRLVASWYYKKNYENICRKKSLPDGVGESLARLLLGPMTSSLKSDVASDSCLGDQNKNKPQLGC